MTDISVVMPLFTGEAYLAEAIESILNQSFSNFELIIVCEYGSSEKCLEIAEEYAKKDSRIILVHNSERLGISESINIGMRMAEGKYIARMDSDDISGIHRFKYQKEFMDTYTDIGICGTKHTVIGAPHWLVDYYADPKQIKSELLFFVPLRHPTIMMRKSVIESNQLYYDKNIPGAEDYDFFIRASRITQLSNLMDKELFAYRRAEGNVSALNKERDTDIRISLMKNLLVDDLHLYFDDKDINNMVITTVKEYDESLLRELEEAVLKIVEQNELLGVYDHNALCKTMIHRWHREKYSIDLRFKNKPPQDLINCWRQGVYYRSWME